MPFHLDGDLGLPRTLTYLSKILRDFLQRLRALELQRLSYLTHALELVHVDEKFRPDCSSLCVPRVRFIAHVDGDRVLTELRIRSVKGPDLLKRPHERDAAPKDRHARKWGVVIRLERYIGVNVKHDIPGGAPADVSHNQLEKEK
jgi:hypothetical protein